MFYLSNDACLTHTPDHLHIRFSSQYFVTSSSVLNGGMVKADHIINIKVPKISDTSLAPEKTLLDYAHRLGCEGLTVGMMTAASMNSFRMAKETEQGIDIAVAVTSGLANLRRVADPAEYRLMTTAKPCIGTINIIVVTSARLTETAAIEAVLMVTEAKTAALQEAGVKSPISNQIATGTGTDSVAIASAVNAEVVQYCGKHVLFGEILGKLVKETVLSSITWELEK